MAAHPFAAQMAAFRQQLAARWQAHFAFAPRAAWGMAATPTPFRSAAGFNMLTTGGLAQGAFRVPPRFAFLMNAGTGTWGSFTTPAAGVSHPAMLTTHPVVTTHTATATNPTGNVSNVENTLPSNADQNLGTLYKDYQAFVSGGSSGTFTSSESAIIVINGTDVGINAHANHTGDFNAYVSALKGLGMQVQATDASTETVAGMIPIAKLPDAASLPQTLSLTPMYKPVRR